LTGGHDAVRDRCATGSQAWQGLPRLNNQADDFEFGVDRHQIAAQVFGLGFLLSTGQPGFLRGEPHERKPAHRPIWACEVWDCLRPHLEESMKITLSVIKADIGSIGGHIVPSRRLLETVRAQIAERGSTG
jgi:hypothetical protein